MRTFIERIRAALLTTAAVVAIAAPVAASAQVKVGVTLSATGPAASLGIPQKNSVALLPKTIGGKKVEYIVLDDASDTTTAVKNTRKLISEDNVDVDPRLVDHAELARDGRRRRPSCRRR